MTLVGYGAQIQVLRAVCDMANEELGISCELILELLFHGT